MAVEQQGGTGHGAGIHAHSPLRIRPDDNEAFPTLAVAFYILLQALQEALLKLQDLLDVHAHNQRLGGLRYAGRRQPRCRIRPRSAGGSRRAY